MNDSVLTMKLLAGTYGVSRLEASSPLPSWASTGAFFSLTKTEDELSIVCDTAVIPEDIICEKPWKILKVQGPLDFALVGIVSKISKVLADNEVSLFVISTYDTDYILVKEKDTSKAVEALRHAFYEIL